jgi:C-terminal processing protease CtpA/Prc
LGVGGALVKHHYAPAAPVQSAEEPAFPPCQWFLDEAARVAFDGLAVGRLNANRLCRNNPADASLEGAIARANGVLAEAFGNDLTRILPAAEAEKLTEWLSGDGAAFSGGGIGVELSVDPSKTFWLDPVTRKPRFQFTGMIFHVIPHSPAAKAGLQDGDVITRIGGIEVTGLDADKVISEALHGDIGSTVSIAVTHADGTEKEHTLTREKVIPDHVWSRNLGFLDASGENAYRDVYAIVVSDFVPETAARIVAEVRKIGPSARGYVLYFRGNPGGDFDRAIYAVAPFLREGKIVSKDERVPGNPDNPRYIQTTIVRRGVNVVKEVRDLSTGELLSIGNLKVGVSDFDAARGEIRFHQTEEFPFVGGKPIVVLADEDTKSAAEIALLALTDNYVAGADETTSQGAVFLGDKPTGGKGSVQTYYRVAGGALLRVTTAHWYGPNGDWLGDGRKMRYGRAPSIRVVQPDNAVPFTITDQQLLAAIQFILKAH